MSSYRSFVRRAAAVAGVLTLSVAPLSSFAATSTHADYTQIARSSSRTSYSSSFGRERYSSDIQKKMRALDSDKVEEMAIPVAGVTLKSISPNFGDPRDGGARTHEGEDIIAARGSLVISPTDAVVTSTGKSDSPGIYVYTANPGGERFAYFHLDSIAERVKPGTVLKPGDIIGFVGNTGNASGGVTHLHFEIRDGRTPTDPFPRLTRVETTDEYIRTLITTIASLEARIKKQS